MSVIPGSLTSLDHYLICLMPNPSMHLSYAALSLLLRYFSSCFLLLRIAINPRLVE